MQKISTRPGKRIRIFVGETANWHGKSLYRAIFDLAAQHHVLAVTIQRGIEGFGPEHHISTERLVEMADNLPIIVEIIDTIQHIEPLITKLDPLVQSGVMTVTPVEIIQS